MGDICAHLPDGKIRSKGVASINRKLAAIRPNPPQIKKPIPAKFLKTKNTRVRMNFHSIKWPYFGVVPSLASDWVSVVRSLRGKRSIDLALTYSFLTVG